MSTDDVADWTRGGDGIALQHCTRCLHRWAFARPFCPRCGAVDPRAEASAGRGTVHATTLVHRAPDDAFRAVVPYRLVLVDLDEGVRVMGHGDTALAIGDRVEVDVREIAGRRLPYFLPDHPQDTESR